MHSKPEPFANASASEVDKASDVLHIISRSNWAKAQATGVLVDPSLEAEGFIHCSYPQQVLTPANERFSGQADLLLLVISPVLLDSPLIVEDSYGSGVSFPHVYGPINISSVRETLSFPCNEDGTFTLPFSK